jgi:hypothetical protein
LLEQPKIREPEQLNVRSSEHQREESRIQRAESITTINTIARKSEQPKLRSSDNNYIYGEPHGVGVFMDTSDNILLIPIQYQEAAPANDAMSSYSDDFAVLPAGRAR